MRLTLEDLFCAAVFGVATFGVLAEWARVRSSLCWLLVYLARGLELAKRCWGSVVYEGPLARWGWTARPVDPSRFGLRVWVLTPLGEVLWFPASWMYPAAVSLVVFANRYLPPLPKDAGFLARLYPRPGDW